MSITIFLLALSSGIFHALWNFFSKKGSGNLQEMVLGFWFADLTLIPFSFFIIKNYGFDIRAIPFIIFTSFVHVGYYFFISKTYSFGEISLGYPVARGSGVILTAIFGMLILREHISLYSWMGIIAIIIGISGRAFSRDTLSEGKKGLKYSFFQGVMIVLYTLTDKTAVHYCNPVVYFNCKDMLALILMSHFVFRGKCGTLDGMKSFVKEHWKYSAIIGYGALISYLIILFIYSAFPESNVSSVIPIREFSVVIGSVLGFIFLKEKVTLNKILGILFIVAGTILIKIG